jgi:4-amino-4-deoxy-L-arabinose transferase-like glycosyltransferase
LRLANPFLDKDARAMGLVLAFFARPASWMANLPANLPTLWRNPPMCLPLTGLAARFISSPITEINSALDTRLQKREFHFFFLALLACAVLFAKLHVGDLNGFDDAVYAHEGKTMLLTGDWWNVRLNGRLDFDKPPLFIWLEALSMTLFGITDFAARFPSALLGWWTILLVYFIARELSDDYWLPVLAMFSLLTTQYFIKWAMHAMTDVPFTFFFALAVFAYLKALRNPPYLLLSGLAVAACIMTRSILGLIPLGVLLVHLLVTGRTDLWFSRWLLGGLLLAFGLPLIWFISQYQWHGETFLALHFSYTVENLPASQGKSWLRVFDGWLQYAKQMVEACWRWLPFMIGGFVLQARAALWKRDKAAWLLIVWVLGVLVPFSLIQNKWLRYWLPAFPALSLLAAIALNQLLAPLRRPLFLKYAYALLLAFFVTAALLPKYRVRVEEMRTLVPVAQAVAPAEQRLLLYTFGKQRMDYLSQVVWYADRYCEHLTDLDELRTRLQQASQAAVIIDKKSFAELRAKLPGAMEVLAEAGNFVCAGKKPTTLAESL